MSEQFRIALEEYPMEWIVKLCGAQDKHLRAAAVKRLFL